MLSNTPDRLSDRALFTIGHSTHSADTFVNLLKQYAILRLADIRTVPRSRRHPHFNSEALSAFLNQHGITYRHFPALGGLRKPKRDSVNTGWRHPSFRGYADHMQTAEFAAGVDELLQYSESAATTVMCAEAVWWQCHRQLLADALVVRGVAVWHIVPGAAPKPHQLSDFARTDGVRLTYPGLL